jgi:ketol-acid reductoisomerase
MTQISDGATQADYVLPRVISTELKRQCVKFKLVGNLVHGHAINFSSGFPAHRRQLQFGKPLQ